MTPRVYIPAAVRQAESVEFTVVIDDPATLRNLKQLFGHPFEEWGNRLDLQQLIINHVALVHQQYQEGRI